MTFYKIIKKRKIIKLVPKNIESRKEFAKMQRFAKTIFPKGFGGNVYVSGALKISFCSSHEDNLILAKNFIKKYKNEKEIIF